MDGGDLGPISVTLAGVRSVENEVAFLSLRLHGVAFKFYQEDSDEISLTTGGAFWAN